MSEEMYQEKAFAILQWMNRNKDIEWVQSTGRIWIANLLRMVAQLNWIEQLTSNQQVEGSSPSAIAKFENPSLQSAAERW